VGRDGGAASDLSLNVSSRLRQSEGSATTSASSCAANSSEADSGRSTKVAQSPRESSSARRRFSFIIGPRMKPSSSGAGSQRSFQKT
jgi:hypothetical protein